MKHPMISSITLSSVLLLLSGCSHQDMQVRTSYTGKDVTEGQTAEQLYQKGKVLFKQNMKIAALKYFRASYNIDPASLKTLNGLAGAYDSIKRFDLSVDYYFRALTINPKSVSTLNNLGYSYLLQDNVELAIYYFRVAETVDPENVKVQNNLARAENAYEGRMLAQGTDIFSPPDPMENSSGNNKPDQIKNLEKMFVEEENSNKIVVVELPAPPKRAVGYQLSLKKAEPSPKKLAHKIKENEQQKIVQNTPEIRVLVSRPKTDVNINFKNTMIEFSNGAGRRSLAWRMKKFAEGNNVEVQRLTNADHYSHMESTIYFKPGWKGEADELSKLFPIPITIKEKTNQFASLRLEIGGDLLEFDKSLINQLK